MNAICIIDELNSQRNEESIGKLIDYVKTSGFSNQETLYLANVLAHSGIIIKNDQYRNLADIPSTGGPGSLSTLICPVFLKLLGCDVLKLGVPGRPAGGIDVLSLISGFNTDPNEMEISDWMKSSRYVHFLANDTFTPLDKLVFNYRKANNALNIPELVIASILAKKLAAGIKYVGLDVRVSESGNFGSNLNDAKNNAKKFNEVASLANIKSRCFITDGTKAQQPFIGRGEALLAMKKIFSNSMPQMLKRHLNHCFSMAYSVSPNKSLEVFSLDKLKENFLDNIVVQGGSINSFYHIADEIECEHEFQILASESGFLNIDLYRIRDSIITAQQKVIGIRFADPCGVVLIKEANDFVNVGDIICTFRCVESEFEIFSNDLKMSFTYSTHLQITNEFEEIS